MCQRLLTFGELWIRREDKEWNDLTPNGRYWERANPRSKINESDETLTIDTLELKNKNPYIVALLHDEHDREIPKPLGKPIQDHYMGYRLIILVIKR
jgi:hypothetical protein